VSPPGAVSPIEGRQFRGLKFPRQQSHVAELKGISMRKTRTFDLGQVKMRQWNFLLVDQSSPIFSPIMGGFVVDHVVF